MALFAADVEEYYQTPNKYEYWPYPSPRTHQKYAELLEQSDDADHEERETAQPMTQHGTCVAEVFLSIKKHKEN
jgi:hypothetical protein